MSGLRTALLYLTNRITYSDGKRLSALQRGLGSDAECWFLFDAAGRLSPPNARRFPIHTFWFQALHQLGIPVHGDRLIPGNAFLPVVDFFRAHPNYDRYWLIENDVRFSGNWAHFFRTLEPFDHDLVTTHVRRHDEEPDWNRWELWHPLKSIPLQERVRSFNPLYRLSQRALAWVSAEMATGWRGHNEVRLVSLLHLHGAFRVLDLGGRGSFTPPELHGRFYRRTATPNGSGFMTTYRFRPPFLFTGLQHDRLYHPVKPLKSWAGHYVRALRRRPQTS